MARSALSALPLQGVCSYWLIPYGHTPALPATSTPLKTLLSRIPIPDPAGYAIDFQGSTTERQAENKTPAGPKPPVGKAKGADSRDGARTHALVGGRSAQRALGPQGVGTKGPRALSTGCLFWPKVFRLGSPSRAQSNPCRAGARLGLERPGSCVLSMHLPILLPLTVITNVDPKKNESKELGCFFFYYEFSFLNKTVQISNVFS